MDPRLLLPFSLLAACATQTRPDGPLVVRNQHPAQLTALHMDPAGVTSMSAGAVKMQVDTAYTSLFLHGAGSGNTFSMDGEALRTGWKTSFGLGRDLTLHTEIGAIHAAGGFLDDFVIGWHEFWGFPDQGRDVAPKDQFKVRATQAGQTVYELEENGITLADLPVGISWTAVPITDEQPWGLSLRGAVEFPTGDEDKGTGNGAIDFALGVVGEYRWRRLALTGHAQHSFVGTSSSTRRIGFRFADVTSVGLGAEMALTDSLTLLVQTEAETSTLRRLGFDRVSDIQWLIWVGGRTRLSESVSLEFALGEDLSTMIAPDFTAYLGFRVELGGDRTKR